MKRMDVRFAACWRLPDNASSVSGMTAANYSTGFSISGNEAKNHMQWHPVSDIINRYDNRE